MRKQILILISIGIGITCLFLLVGNSDSNSGTLFEAETEVVGADEIAYADEGLFALVDTEDLETTLQEMVFVDIQGEVVNPGVFEVNHDVRVGYLIELAGGLTDYANTRGLNQAARIYDEMVIFVPHLNDDNEPIPVRDSNHGQGEGTNESGLISLSAASSLELQSLPGIGPTLSANIIAHREVYGTFSSVDELLNVAGIGAGILENIREFIKP